MRSSILEPSESLSFNLLVVFFSSSSVKDSKFCSKSFIELTTLPSLRKTRLSLFPNKNDNMDMFIQDWGR